MHKPSFTSKVIGGMLGSALGDAIGELAFRYRDRGSLIRLLEQVPELRYTDDTAMAIGLAESLIREGRVNQERLGQQFMANFEREPWRGYAAGPPTIFSLVREQGITYGEAARTLFDGAGSLGNGAAMRIVPVGLLYHRDSNLYQAACASAEVTHAHPVGMDGAAVQATAVARALQMDPGGAFAVYGFIQDLMGVARTPEIRSKIAAVERLIQDAAPPEQAARLLGRTVAVHESVPFALYSFLTHPDAFEECLFCAILHGGDRDTLGAMACAVSGAYLGIGAVPLAWQEKLENREYIEKLAIDIAERALAHHEGHEESS